MILECLLEISVIWFRFCVETFKLGGLNIEFIFMIQKEFTFFLFSTKVWDNELEMIALANALQCKIKHDRCRKTKHYPSAGQNLYSQSTTNKNAIDDQYIKGTVDGSMESWFDEYKFVKNVEWIKSFGGTTVPWWEIGHFTQMI